MCVRQQFEKSSRSDKLEEHGQERLPRSRKGRDHSALRRLLAPRNEQMRERIPRTVWQAASCVACALITWRFSDLLGPTEFSDGRVTGPLLTIHSFSPSIFVIAAGTVFRSARAAAALALIGCALALPLYVYMTVPGTYRSLAGGVYSVPLMRAVLRNSWAVAGTIAVAAAIYLSLRALSQQRQILRLK